MTSLQTLTVTLEIDNDGEFTTKVKSADGSLESLSKSAQSATKQVNTVSTAFSRASGTLSTLTAKFSTSSTNAKKLDDAFLKIEASANAAQGSMNGLSAAISQFTSAAGKGVTQAKKLNDTLAPMAKNIQTIAKNAGKGADGINRISTAAKNATKTVNSFAIASVGVSNSFSTWGRRFNSAGDAADKLSGKMATATVEARVLRDALGEVQKQRGGSVNNEAVRRFNTNIQPRVQSGGGGAFDNESKSAHAYGTEIDNVTKKLSESGSAHDSFIGKLTRTAFAIDEVTSAANILWESFGGGIERIVEVNAHTEKLITTLKGLSTLRSDEDRQSEAVSQYEQLFNIAQRSPFSLDKLADGFVKLRTANLDNPVAALKSVSDALAHFSASDTQFESAMLAIMQMAGKGVISMEELRRQLGEAMPTAMQNLATAMEVTEGQLVKLVSTGSLRSKAAIQLLMDEFDRMYGGSSEQKMKTFSGQVALMNTNMQRLALTAGGMTADPNKMGAMYGPNSFYGQVTKSIGELNKALESPGAQQAARDLNDALAGITRTLTSLASGLASFAGTFGTPIARVLEFVAAIKAANLAVFAMLGTMRLMEGSSFLQSSGIMRGILSIGQRERPTITKGAMGETIRGTEKTAGAFASTKSFLGDIAEQGVWTALSSNIGSVVAKTNDYYKSLVMAGNAGASASMKLSSGFVNVIAGMATMTTLSVGVVAAVGAIAAGWYLLDKALNRVTDSTNIVGKALQNVAQGDTSKDTMKAAAQELSAISERRETMQRIVDQSLAAKEGQTFDARGFGDTLGAGELKVPGKRQNWFQRLIGERNDEWLEAGTAQAEQYKERAQEALAIVKAQQAEAQRILTNAPTMNRDRDAQAIEREAIGNVNILMRSPEANYAAQIQQLNQRRLTLSNDSSDEAKAALGQVNDQQAQAVLQENREHIALLKQQIALQEKFASYDKKSGNTDAYLTRSQAIKNLNKDLQNLEKDLDAAQQRLGKFDLTTAGKTLDREQRNAQNWMNAANGKIMTLQESRNDNIPGASFTEQMKAWQSAGGKFADLGDTLKRNMMDIADQLDRATASTKNWNDAMKAVKTSQDEINSAVQSYDAANLASQIEESPLGKDYATQVAKINQNETRGLRGFDVDSSGLSAQSFDSVTEALTNASTAYSQLQESVSSYTRDALQAGGVTGDMTNSVNIMSQSSSDASGGVNSLSSALQAYELQTVSAGNATQDLANQIRLIDASNVAKSIAAAAAAVRGANADIETARRQKEAYEKPSERKADRTQDINAAYSARKSAIDSLLGDSTHPMNTAAISALAKQQGISLDRQIQLLRDNEKTIEDARQKSLDAVNAQYQKSMSRSSGSRSNPINSLRENIAKYTADLNGGDGAMAKFGQRMRDMGKPIDDTTRKLMAQESALKARDDAQNRALKNAQYYIENAGQDHDKASQGLETLRFGDPSSVSASLAQVKAEYDSVIADINKNVSNPMKRDSAIEELQSVRQGAVQQTLNTRLQSYNQKMYSDDDSDAYSNADLIAKKISQLRIEINSMNNGIANSGWNTEQQNLAFNTTAKYYEAAMQRIKVANQGTLSQTGRQWNDWNKNVQDGVNSSMDGLMSTMSDALANGTANWKSFGQSILKVFSDLTMKLAMSPIMTLMGNFMDGASGNKGGWANSLVNLFGMGGKTASAGGGIASDLSGVTAPLEAVGQVPLKHSGGIVGSGEGSGYRSVPLSLFDKATRYHTGGIAGDEVPTILQKGEGVFTAGQMKAIGDALSSANARSSGMASAVSSMAQTRSSTAFDAKKADNAIDNIGKNPKGSANVKINMTNQTGQNIKMSTSQPKWDGESFVIDTVIKHAQRPGNLRNTLKSSS